MGRMFAFPGVGPHTPHRMNQTLHQRTGANPQARSRQGCVAGAIEVRPVTTRSALPACVELQEAVGGPGYTGMRVAITTSNTDGHPDRSVPREIHFEFHKPFRLSSGMAAERTVREALSDSASCERTHYVQRRCSTAGHRCRRRQECRLLFEENPGCFLCVGALHVVECTRRAPFSLEAGAR